MGEAFVISLLPNLGSSLLGRMASLVSKQLVLAWRLEDDLDCLKESSQLSQALLSDAVDTTDPNKKRAVQFWLLKLTATVHDANFLLDELEYEVHRQKVENHVVRKCLSLLYRHKMASKIRNVNSSFEKIYKIGTGMGMRPLVSRDSANIATTHEIIRQTPPNIDDFEVVGREKDKLMVIEMLRSSTNEEVSLSVVAIVGMGGLGKTTLAQNVYNSNKVVNHFQKRMWITLSEDFDAAWVLNEMLQSLTLTNHRLSNLEALIKKLNEEMTNKKFLLVLDDVWNELPNKWDVMRRSLQGISGTTGNKILITTRNYNVAFVMQSSFVYTLQGLSDHASLELFKKIAFADGGATKTQNLVAIGERMVKQCNGLPLAIKTLGGVLYFRRSVHDWLSIEKNPCWNSIDVLPSLRISFDHLPMPALKLCFAYYSIFPKGFIINKACLIQQWMALGLLHDPRRDDMEGIGEDYFNILLRNSLLQNVIGDEYNTILGCKMHDLVHDLAVKVSQNQCVTLNDIHNMNDVASEAIHVRLAGGDKMEKFEYLKRRCKRLQALHIMDCFHDSMLIIKLERLLVLVLSDKSIHELPSSIGKLKHLKYLDIFGTGIERLPDPITKLYCLQTLRFKFLKELPKQFFKKLINLRHLCFEWISNCRFRGIGKLTCLRTLPLFVVSQASKCQVEELGGLDNLTSRLEIRGLGDVRSKEEAIKAKLSLKSNIHALKLSWYSNSGEKSAELEEESAESVLEGLQPHCNLKGLEIWGFNGNSFAPWMSSFVLQNLTRIRLVDCSRCKQIPPLGDLPHLEVLSIEKMSCVKIIGDDFYGVSTGHSDVHPKILQHKAAVSFPALRRLHLRHMPVLEEWAESPLPSISAASHRLFPHLTELEIVDCPHLIDLPGHFPTLLSLIVDSIKDATPLEKMSASLTSLTNLRMSHIPGTEVERVVEQLLSHNRLLMTIQLLSCHELSYVRCNSLSYLTHLQVVLCEKLAEVALSKSITSLYLTNCPALIIDHPVDLRFLAKLTYLTFGGRYSLRISELDYLPWPYLPASLQSLELRGWENLKSLAAPQHLRDLSLLKYLRLYNFHGLESLPDWLGDLANLQYLEIHDCRNVIRMPSKEAMGGLGNLNVLVINNCPQLKERCSKGSGVEWYKIARVPNIYIDGVPIHLCN